ncbi:MAG: hypothetical protein HC874_32340 [Richelia sp. SL_2_1]|nr:hypothetical protein [Richelia sp. SL_2_1]
MAKEFEILNAKINIEFEGVDKATKDINKLGKEVNSAFDSIDLSKLGKSNITQSFKQVEDGLKRLAVAGKEASGLKNELSFLKSISFNNITTESGKAKTALVDMLSGSSKAAQSARSDIRLTLQDMAKDINALGEGTTRLDKSLSSLQNTRDVISKIQKDFNKPINLDLFNLDNVLKAQETPIGKTVANITNNLQSKFKTTFGNIASDVKLFGELFSKNYNSTITKSVADPIVLAEPIKKLIAEVTSTIRTLPDKTNPSTIKITDDFNRLKNEFLTASSQLKHFYEVLNSPNVDLKSAKYATQRIEELEIKVKSSEKAIRDMSDSVTEFAKVSQSAQIADLINKFNDINNSVTIANRGIGGFLMIFVLVLIL